MHFVRENRKTVSMQSLQLTVPTPEEVEDPRTLLDVDVLRERVEHLALAVPWQAAEQMLEALARLNRHPTDSSHREELADLYWLAFQQLRRHCNDIANGVTRASRKALRFQEVMRRLAIELGYAYKHVILRRWQNIQARGRGEIGRSALLHALEALSFQLLFLYEQHDRDAGQLWREVFLIYQLAEREGVQRKYLKSPSGDGEHDKVTIDMRLARVLLIRLLDPWRMATGELWMAHAFLDEASALARIARCDEPGILGPRFAFSLAHGHLPRALRTQCVDELSADCRLLLTARLNQHVGRELARLGEGEGGLKSDARQRMLKLMLSAWSDLPERRAQRKPARGWVEVVWGLEAVAHFLGGEKEGRDLELASDVELTEAIGIGRQASRSFSMTRWRCIDGSAAGMRLELPLGECEAPRAGDILLLQRGGRRQLGYICWLQHHGERAARVGVGLLRGEFRAVRVKPVAIGKTLCGQLPALLADSERQGVGGLGLLIERGAYHGASEFLVDDGERLYRLDARQLVDRTATFDYLDVVLMRSS